MSEREINRGRRRFLQGSAVALMAPYVARRARAAQELYVRTPGGSYNEQRVDTLFKPFERETGIKIIPVASTAGKLVAMFRAGRAAIDVIETGDDILYLLEDMGALARIDYGAFRYTNPADIDARYKRDYHVASTVYADVLGFNTETYAVGTEPQSWAQFWDAEKFPGPRSMADMASGAPNLEFALMADGVGPDKLYPIDLDRAFKSLSRIRPAVVKFWSSGAIATQMLVDKEAYLSTIWSSRANAARLGGAPVAIGWNQNLVNLTATAIAKNTPSMTAAKAYLDYSLSPEVQARIVKASQDVPVNKKAYSAIPPELIDPKAGVPWTESKGTLKNSRWWADNRQAVSDYWSRWILG